ncbi:MAG: NAD(P)H-quinone dehydrogenase [Pseudonocardia sp.]
MIRIVIMGGGPAGYEAALVASQHGSDVVVVERDGMGGACVLDDCVPSKTFISSAAIRVDLHRGADLGLLVDREAAVVDLPTVHRRVRALALAQSTDVREHLERKGVRIIQGTAAFTDRPHGRASHLVEVRTPDGGCEDLPADVVLIATGATPRILDDARPDGERILTWCQLYDLDELPEHLVVIGSGVTGAEFVSAYVELGTAVTLVSSRDRVLPDEDVDASAVLRDVFVERGVRILAQARAESVARDDSGAGGVLVTLADGATVRGSHALMTVGSVPNTVDLGLAKIGIEIDRGGFIPVDRVSRTSVPGVYAAGDCTGVLMLASVAAMQGRIAMWHALGEGVAPIKLKTVAAAVFTRPEIATVGISQRAIDDGEVPARTIMLPLATNPRAKMQGLRRGFVKLFCRPATGVVIGGVVVAPVASELILPIALAVRHGLTVDDLAYTFSVYPSLSGSITEAGRQLMRGGDLD